MTRRYLALLGGVFVVACVVSFFAFSRPAVRPPAAGVEASRADTTTNDSRSSAREPRARHQQLAEAAKALAASSRQPQVPAPSLDNLPTSMTPYAKMALKYASFHWMQIDVGLYVTGRIHDGCRKLYDFSRQIKLVFDASIGPAGATIRNPRVTVLSGAPMSAPLERCVLEALTGDLKVPPPKGWGDRIPEYSGEIEHFLNMGGAS
jgi:hypothetical protein